MSVLTRHNLNEQKWRGVLRLVFYIALFLLLFPVVMLLLYRLPFIHPVSTLMIKDSVALRDFKRHWVALEDISPQLKYAVMMSEDGRFCVHNGVDWNALHSVITREGGPSRGASTITMQTVKNLFLWHDRSYLRKGFEIPYAVIADTILPKDRILEIYLNIAEWGPGIYGVEAASQYYFKRPAKNISARQAAYLAVALPNPYVRNPARPSRRLSQLARLVEARTYRSGAYTQCVR